MYYIPSPNEFRFASVLTSYSNVRGKKVLRPRFDPLNFERHLILPPQWTVGALAMDEYTGVNLPHDTMHVDPIQNSTPDKKKNTAIFYFGIVN